MGGEFTVTLAPASQTANELFAQPSSFTLAPAFPNPFNGQTVRRLTVDKPGGINVSVFDIQGRLVKTLELGEIKAGDHQIAWDGTNGQGRIAETGLYIIQGQLGTQSLSQKVLLLK